MLYLTIGKRIRLNNLSSAIVGQIRILNNKHMKI